MHREKLAVLLSNVETVAFEGYHDDHHGPVGVIQDSHAEDGATILSKMVHDRFHVAQHLGWAVDRVHMGEHRALLEASDCTLAGTKHECSRPHRDQCRRKSQKIQESLSAKPAQNVSGDAGRR